MKIDLNAQWLDEIKIESYEVFIGKLLEINVYGVNIPLLKL